MEKNGGLPTRERMSSLHQQVLAENTNLFIKTGMADRYRRHYLSFAKEFGSEEIGQSDAVFAIGAEEPVLFEIHRVQLENILVAGVWKVDPIHGEHIKLTHVNVGEIDSATGELIMMNPHFLPEDVELIQQRVRIQYETGIFSS
jgi:hypothetical protein